MNEKPCVSLKENNSQIVSESKDQFMYLVKVITNDCCIEQIGMGGKYKKYRL